MHQNFKMPLLLNYRNNFFYPEVICQFSGEEKNIYITFDDGPTPGITSQVLALLFRYQAKATFFCSGKQVEQNQEIFKEILSQGHSVGNHSFSHLNGWYTNNNKYFDDCEKANALIYSNLFRPPYGKLKPSQYNYLKRLYTIIHWTALSWDFHPWITPGLCLRIVSKNIRPGAILVFHDTAKAANNLLFVLPRILEIGSQNGYRFCAIPMDIMNR